jgi:hypothetical protein
MAQRLLRSVGTRAYSDTTGSPFPLNPTIRLIVSIVIIALRIEQQALAKWSVRASGVAGQVELIAPGSQPSAAAAATAVGGGCGFEHHQASRSARANFERSAWVEVKWTVVMLIRRAPSTLDSDLVRSVGLTANLGRLCF